MTTNNEEKKFTIYNVCLNVLEMLLVPSGYLLKSASSSFFLLSPVIIIGIDNDRRINREFKRQGVPFQIEKVHFFIVIKLKRKDKVKLKESVENREVTILFILSPLSTSKTFNFYK